MSEPAIDPRLLRVSDDERSHVLRLLEKATGRGLINLDEYNDRSELVLAARTRGELNAVLLDLPGLHIAGRTVDQARQEVSAPTAAGPGYSGAPRMSYGPAQTLELTGWGSRSFKGHWTVPAKIVVGGFGASTKLDFSEAVLTSRVVTIEFRGNFGGSCELILPRGASVRFDGLAMRGASMRNKLTPGGHGIVDLVLTGTKSGGAVAVRYSRQNWWAGQRQV